MKSLIVFILLITTGFIGCQSGKKDAVYQNTTYNFSYTFPASYEVKSYNPENITLSSESLPNIECQVFAIDEWLTVARENQVIQVDCDKAYCIVAIERAVTHCAADGPDGSIYGHSPTVERFETTSNNMEIVRFDMKLTEEQFSTSETIKNTRTIGPFFAVNISHNHVLLLRFSPWEEVPPYASEKLMRAVQSIKNIK